MLGSANSIAGRDRAGLSARGWSARCAVWARAENFYISLHSSCIRSFPINHVQRCLAMWVHFLLLLLHLLFFWRYHDTNFTCYSLFTHYFVVSFVVLLLYLFHFISYNILLLLILYFLLLLSRFLCFDWFWLTAHTMSLLATVVPTSETVKETSVCSLLTLYNLPEWKNSCILPHELCANRLNITFSLFPRCDSADIWTAHLLVRVMSGVCNRLLYNTTYILVKI